MAGILPFNHLKYINGCLKLIALRISSGTLLYKLQNATENCGIPDKCQQPKIVERLVLWYEFVSHEKFNHVKLLIKEKCPHTIITERYRFCCFKTKRDSFFTACNNPDEFFSLYFSGFTWFCMRRGVYNNDRWVRYLNAFIVLRKTYRQYLELKISICNVCTKLIKSLCSRRKRSYHPSLFL